MITDAIDKALIYSGPALDACLCGVMIAKQRWREFPSLLVFGFLDLASSPILYWVDPSGTSRSYVRLYVAFGILTFVLELLILYDVARNVLRPEDAWDSRALKVLVSSAVAGTGIALLATLFLQPSGMHGPAVIQFRADIFESLVVCELVVAVMLSASTFGLSWRNHVMAVGQGLMFWSLILASEEGAFAYLGPNHPYSHIFYYVRGFNYLVVVGYWTVSLWYEEPARKPISPALRKYVVALHERVQYDLGNTGL